MIITELRPDQSLRLSDADRELLARRFITDDPLSIPGLLPRIPDGAPQPEIEARYDLNGSGRAKLLCAHCHGHRHLKGYVIRFPSGDVALIGHHCGGKAFGFAWQEVERGFNAEYDRQLDLRRAASVHPLLPAYIAELEAALDQGHDQTIGRFIDTLRRHFGKLSQTLGRAARDEGRLRIEIKERDTEAEQDKARDRVPDLVDDAERVGHPKTRNQAIKRLKRWIEEHAVTYKYDEAIVGRCAGYELFQPGLKTDHLKEALALARRAQKALTGDSVGLDLGGALQLVQASCEAASITLDQLALFASFTQPENLDLVAQVVNRAADIPGHVRREGRLLVEDGGKTIGTVVGWSLPTLRELAKVKEALRASAFVGEAIG